MKLREVSRPKLSPRYGAVQVERADRERTNLNPVPILDLRRLVATMID